MSVWTSLFAAPQSLHRLSYEQFEAFVFDLLHQRIVRMPCAVLGGAVDVQLTLGMARLFDGYSYERLASGAYQVHQFLKEYQTGATIPYEDKGFITFYYQGQDEAALRQALRDFPYGQQDLCVWFVGLDYENPIFADNLAIDTSSPDALIYALARPQTVACVHEEWKPKSELPSLEGVTLEPCPFPGADEDAEGAWMTVINEYAVECCFRTAALKGGPYEIIGTPLEPILKQHFGPDLITDCNYS